MYDNFFVFWPITSTKLYFLVKEDSLEIYTPEQSFIMYAGTKNEKKVWLQKLRTAVAMSLHGEEANDRNEIGKTTFDICT